MCLCLIGCECVYLSFGIWLLFVSLFVRVCKCVITLANQEMDAFVSLYVHLYFHLFICAFKFVSICVCTLIIYVFSLVRRAAFKDNICEVTAPLSPARPARQVFCV
jgi:hypothetical protein